MNRFRTLLILLFSASFMFTALPTFAQEGENPELPTATCSLVVEAGDPNSSENGIVKASVFDLARPGEWPFISFGDGDRFSFRIGDDGNGSTEMPHYFAPGSVWTVRFEDYPSCFYEFEVVINPDTGAPEIKVHSSPNNEAWMCQFERDEWMSPGSNIALFYWVDTQTENPDGNNHELDNWVQTNYTVEAKEDGVFINWGRTAPNEWGYSIFFLNDEGLPILDSAYIPLIYSAQDVPDRAWDEKGNCYRQPNTAAEEAAA